MLKYLGSVKFTIVLLILIVAGSIVGTLIPQNWSEHQYRERYGDGRYEFLVRLELTDVYHSIWYIVLLAVFGVNLCVCSVQGFGPLIKSLQRSSSTAGRVGLKDLPFYRNIKLSAEAKSAGSDKAAQRIKDDLTRRLYRLKYTDMESGIYYFERGKIGRFGPLITHASIVIIVASAILVAVFGFKEYRKIPVGKTIDVPHSDFQIRADDFKVELYPDSRTPKEYTSVLTVIENGVPQVTKAIEVNYPLNYKGVKFFQSSYGIMPSGKVDTIEVELSRKVPDKPDNEVIGKFKIKIEEMFEIPDSQVKIKLISLMPDFVIDSSTGQVHTRSRSFNNPAALLELYEGDELKGKSWSFLKFPEFPHQKESDYTLKFVSVDTGPEVYYTGIQIGYDPGVSFIWLGCLIMIIGMFLSFYLSFKRVWVRLSTDSVEIGGRSYKGKAGFEKEFARLKAMLG